MKKIILILCFLLMNFECFGTTLTGGIEYTVQDARLELQNNKPTPIDFFLIQENYLDKNKKENQEYLLKGIAQTKDRTLAKFSDNTYGVIYNNDKQHVWYYNSDGTLLYVENKVSLQYPYRTYKYTPDEELVNMTLRVSEDETFIFDTYGHLIGHWIGTKCYDEQGNIVMTRKITR